MTDIPAADRTVTATDNQTPHDAFSLALDDAYDTAKDFLDGKPIENQGQADRIGTIVGEVKKIRRDADEARKEEKRPHDEAAKAVQAKWLPLLDRAETILTAAQAPLTAYLRKLAEEQAQVERKAREEAAAKAQKAIEAQRAAQGSVEAVEAAKALQREADAAAKLARKAGGAKAHVAGADRAIGLRTYTIATVTDRRALLEHVMRTDPDALTRFLEEYATKALPAQLPGVTVSTERKVA